MLDNTRREWGFEQKPPRTSTHVRPSPRNQKGGEKKKRKKGMAAKSRFIPNMKERNGMIKDDLQRLNDEEKRGGGGERGRGNENPARWSAVLLCN